MAARCACKNVSIKDAVAGFCACVNFAIPLTLLLSMNALFTDWLNSFAGSRGSTTAVQATCIGVTLGGGLIAGLVERKLGERMSLLTGSVLAAVGLFSGSFARSLPMLIFCAGVVTGSGFCLLHLSTLCTALRRFSRRAGFVSSAMATTAGLMHLGTPLLYRYLSEVYTWRGCLILASGLSLHTAIFALLLTSPLLNTTQPPGIQSASRDLLGNVAEDPAAYDPVAKDMYLEKATQERLDTQCKGEPVADTVSGSVKDSVAMETQEGDLDCVKNCDIEEQVRITCAGENSLNSVKDAHNGKDSKDSKSEKKSRLFNSDCRNIPISDEDALTAYVKYHKDEGESSEHGDEPEQERLHFLPSTNIRINTQQQKIHFGNNDGTKLSEEGPESQGNELEKHSRPVPQWTSNAAFLRNPLYLSVMVQVVTALSLIVCFVFLVLDFAVLKGWTVEDGVLLNFTFLLSSLIGRATIGVVSLHRRVHSVMLLVVSGMIGGFGLCLIGQASSIPLACTCYACLGVGYGGIVGMFPTAVLRATGPDHYPIGLGLVCTMEGIFDAMAGISTGLLVDWLQSYSIISLVYGVSTLVATCLLLVVFRCCQPIRTSDET